MAFTATVENDRERLWMLPSRDGEVCCEAPLLRGEIQGRIVWNGGELHAFMFPDDGQL